MPPRFSLQKPYVIASLPRPIDRSNGRYVVGDVYGSRPSGTKKRKRAELVVGVDGEGLNLYDISSSRLITAYALPPQTSITCPPTSFRTRISKRKAERRTYVSTTRKNAHIILFHDYIDGSGSTESSTSTCEVGSSQEPIVYIGTISADLGPEDAAKTADLLVVKEDGEIQCLDGNSLRDRWTSPARTFERDDTVPTKDLKVEFAHLTNAHAASQGILKGRQDVFALFSQEISEDGFNPDILVLITRSRTQSSLPLRTLRVVALPRRAGTRLNGMNISSIDFLLTANLPSQNRNETEDRASFSLHVSAGVLQQLSGNLFTTFDLNDTLPKQQSRILSSGAQSFLRLSNASVMVSSEESIKVYNPKFQSLLAVMQLQVERKPESLKRKRKIADEDERSTIHMYNLCAYFPKLGTAVAIADNHLVAIQIEGQQDRHGNPRAAGLLIDSLGCSICDQPQTERNRRESSTIELTTMESYLPGSIGSGEQSWAEQTTELENSFSAGNTLSFDQYVAEKLGENWKEKGLSTIPLPNGSTTPQNANTGKTSGNNPKVKSQVFSGVDRRWVLYALRKIFTWSKVENGEYKLRVAFYPPNVFMWLIKTGNMTVSNIESALRNEIRASAVDSIPCGNLVDALVNFDPGMDLLLALLAKNFLGATELLRSIRQLMESLGLFGEKVSTMQEFLTNGEVSELANGDVEKEVAKLEKEAEIDLELAEYQLGPGSGVRGQALSLALYKLYTCPSNTIVHALQTNFSSQEIVSLIYLLRFEMARGSWTSKYLDVDQHDSSEEDAEIPDNTIILISSLLNNCVDAIGAGGWLLGDARLVGCDPFESEQLVASLKLEVTAALEGIEQATYLKGLTSEMIRYGDAMQKSVPSDGKSKRAVAGGEKGKSLQKPIALSFNDQYGKNLPIGLKVESQISRLRIGAGGEVHERRSRDIGHMKSQKVGEYSLERINI